MTDLLTQIFGGEQHRTTPVPNRPAPGSPQLPAFAGMGAAPGQGRASPTSVSPPMAEGGPSARLGRR
jgi:hypothetical protein